jgi:hypothetical protein
VRFHEEIVVVVFWHEWLTPSGLLALRVAAQSLRCLVLLKMAILKVIITDLEQVSRRKRADD